jgi:hypothetical protein
MARFLKDEVLPLLAQSSEIKMVRQKRLTPVNDTENVMKGRDPDFEFLWKVVNRTSRSKQKPKKEVRTSQ